MKKMKKSILLSLTLCMALTPLSISAAGENWELQQQENVVKYVA